MSGVAAAGVGIVVEDYFSHLFRIFEQYKADDRRSEEQTEEDAFDWVVPDGGYRFYVMFSFRPAALLPGQVSGGVARRELSLPAVGSLLFFVWGLLFLI